MVEKSSKGVNLFAEGELRDNSTQPWRPYAFYENFDESITTINHNWLNGRWSGGGPFTLRRTRMDRNHVSVNKSRWNGTVGLGAPRWTYAQAEAWREPTEQELRMAGTKAISLTAPNNPAFDMANFIGELRADGLPNLPGSTLRDSTKLARSAGSEYLNIEFGWAPLVRGVRDFAGVVAKSEQIISQYNRDSHNLIRRRIILDDQSDSANSGGVFTTSPGGPFGYPQGSIISRSFKKTWFSGAYTYYLPTGKGVADKFSRYGSYARKLLGLELTPSTLWELAPWTWALDWYGNTGEVLANVGHLGRDNLVLKYGYIMCHTFKQNVWSASTEAGQLSAVYTDEVKLRREATPYGFGVNLDGLSSKQVAILAALGLSRT